MIRRKQYLYCTDIVPRRTRQRRKQQERLLAVALNRMQNEETTTNQDQVLNQESMFSECELNLDQPGPSGNYACSFTRPEFREYHNSSLQQLDSDNSGSSEEENAEIDEDRFQTASEESSSDDATAMFETRDLTTYYEHSSDVSIEDEVLEIPETTKEEDNGPELNQPLCNCTNTTEGDALLMCLALGLRHSLSWAAMVDILSMINHLFDRDVVKATKYFFMKYMEAGKENTTFHLFCPNCERYLGSKQEIHEKQILSCSCGTTLRDINEASTYFLSLSLGEQIKDLLCNKKLVNALNYRFERKKVNSDAYEDIYDGEVYQTLSAPGQILSEKHNFSYTFNTDGFPVGGKSGKQTCWPIYVQLNELPPKMRSSYMLLAGIYVGKHDPNMKIFMYPFVEEANVLSSIGINWTLNGKVINSKIIPVCACVDSPARSKLLNMTQFNGWYGCTICQCKAESTDCGLRYTLPIINGQQERTHKDIILNAASAAANRSLVQRKKSQYVKGVKGLTPVHTMQYIDLVKGVRPDPLHSQYLGNGRHHTFILHDTAGAEFYIGSDLKMNAISERLLSIKPPSSIMRAPRKFQYISLWKGSEWRSWVLFYGVVCLKGIIPEKYVLHFSLLSSALHILLQKSILPEKLQEAHILLLRYMFLYQEYFGKKAMVYNIHLLLHTKRSIECLGPSWTHSAFGFEGANRFLLQLKKSCSSVAKEMARKYLTFKALPALTEKYASSETSIKFCSRLSGRSLKCFQRIGAAVLVGNGSTQVLGPEQFNCLKSAGIDCHREVTNFEKVIYDGVRFCTSSYSRAGKTDDSFICIRGEARGQIENILCITEEGQQSIVLLVREIIVGDNPIFNDEFAKHCPIRRYLTEGQLLVVRPEDISTQCLAMFLDNGNFICDMPFGCYSDS